MIFDLSAYDQDDCRLWVATILLIWTWSHYGPIRSGRPRGKRIFWKSALMAIGTMIVGLPFVLVALMTLAQFLTARGIGQSAPELRSEGRGWSAPVEILVLLVTLALPLLLLGTPGVHRFEIFRLGFQGLFDGPFESRTIGALFLRIAGLGFLLGGGSRMVVAILGAKPRTPSAVGDGHGDQARRTRYEGGRKIGMLERALVYVLVLLGEFGAIGFLIAAKGFIRSKAMHEDSDFAEYVLVGTLASLSVAVATGLLVDSL